MMMRDNILSYESLSWVLEKSEAGFYLLVASPRMQAHVVKRYLGPGVAALDFMSEKRQGYYFTAVASLLTELPPETRSVFFLNFQAVLFEDDDLKRLNFSRDMLSRLRKNLIFCVTPAGQDRILRGALDFSSFLELTLPFEDELPELQELARSFFPPQDKSTGVQVDIDWSWTKPRLLARAIAWSNQAEARRQAGQYRDATELLRGALEIRERLLGEKHPDTATVYNNLANAYYDMGDYAQAQEFYQKALDIEEKTLGLEHPYTAATFNNLGLVYADVGDYTRALEFHRKALDIREKVFGAEHPETAATYNNLANVFADVGDYAQALAYYQKALDIEEKTLGPKHPNTAASYTNLGNVYADLGDYTRALENCQKALDIREEALGTEHPETAETYNNLATVYADMGDYARALEYSKKALDIWERTLGPEHPSTLTAKHNLALFHRTIEQSQPTVSAPTPTPPNNRTTP